MQNNLNEALAEELYHAERDLKAIDPLSARYPALTEKDAYAIQDINALKRIKEGEKLIGYKIGLTSKAAQKHFGIEKPDFGHLFRKMQMPNGSEWDLSKLLQPKIEGEVAFVMGKDVPMAGLSAEELAKAVDYVTCSFEIIDSRIKDWKINWADTISDNGSSALFMLSEKKTRLNIEELPFLGLALSRNGEVEITGSGAAVMGNPLNAVAFLIEELAKHNKQIKAGDIILSGSVSGMLPIKKDDLYECEIWKLGKVSATFRGGK